jgi:hypothetical protein
VHRVFSRRDAIVPTLFLFTTWVPTIWAGRFLDTWKLQEVGAYKLRFESLTGSTNMALLQFQAPVDYAAQREAFQDFLKHFKAFESASESAATEAIEDLHIDGDGSDEYDFVDDMDVGNDGARRSRRTGRRREPKHKYMQILQEVADRERMNIPIELDDLDTVSLPHLNGKGTDI